MAGVLRRNWGEGERDGGLVEVPRRVAETDWTECGGWRVARRGGATEGVCLV